MSHPHYPQLKDLHHPPRIDSIIRQVCAKHDANRMELLTGSRARPEVKARRELCFIFVYLEKFSYPHAARFLRLNHSSVFYAVRKYLTENPEAARLADPPHVEPVILDPNAPDESGIWAI